MPGISVGTIFFATRRGGVPPRGPSPPHGSGSTHRHCAPDPEQTDAWRQRTRRGDGRRSGASSPRGHGGAPEKDPDGHRRPGPDPRRRPAEAGDLSRAGRPGHGEDHLRPPVPARRPRSGETGLFITLTQREADLENKAASHGWSLEGLHVHQLSGATARGRVADQALFPAADIELTEIMAEVLEVVERVRPARVVFDAIAELRLLAADPTRFQHQIFALRDQFASSGATVIFLDTRPEIAAMRELEHIAHGVILLDHCLTRFGNAQRRLRVRRGAPASSWVPPAWGRARCPPCTPARPPAGASGPPCSSSAANLAREAAMVAEPLAAKKALVLRIDAPRARIALDTDARKVKQILLNLLSNAIKFTDAGEIALLLESAPDGGAVFRVRDTGAESLPRTWRRSFRPSSRSIPLPDATAAGHRSGSRRQPQAGSAARGRAVRPERARGGVD